MPQEKLNAILMQISAEAHALFDKKLASVILFGSYARGDYDAESDVDIALLLHCDREEIRNYMDKLASIATDISLESSLVVSFVCIPYQDYIKWLPTLPFYQNIEREGVRISA